LRVALNHEAYRQQRWSIEWIQSHLCCVLWLKCNAPLYIPPPTTGFDCP